METTNTNLDRRTFLRRLPALAAAAYNAGPGRADAYAAGRRGLPAETVAYVAAIAPSIGASGVASLATSRDGGLWVGTYADGLFKLDGDTVTHWDESQGLPGGWAKAVRWAHFGSLSLVRQPLAARLVAGRVPHLPPDVRPVGHRDQGPGHVGHVGPGVRHVRPADHPGRQR